MTYVPKPRHLRNKMPQFLTPVKPTGKNKYGILYLFKCVCGKTKVANLYQFNCGDLTHCGCKLSEYRSRATRTHGLSGTKIHKTWKHIKDRCLNSKCKSYPNYGGRGITMCERWMVFENFLKDMGQPPSVKHSLDRKDNSKGYCKANCRWATNREQTNNARSNVRISFNGRTQNISQWADELGIKYATLYGRIKTFKWSIEKALTQPSIR